MPAIFPAALHKSLAIGCNGNGVLIHGGRNFIGPTFSLKGDHGEETKKHPKNQRPKNICTFVY